MRAIWGLWKHESRSFLLTPWSSVWLAAWLSSTALLTLVGADLLSQAEVSLLPFFKVLPWMGALFIPVLGMRLWSRETELGTLKWFLSLPHSTLSCVLIKHLAAWQLLALSLLSTLALPLTLGYLGDPDLGVLVSSYFGILGFLSGQLALCHLASALCRRTLAAYGVGLLLCVLYNLPACDLLHDQWPHFFSSGWFGTISRMSPTYNLLGFLRGVIDLRDVIYFFGVVVVCLSLSYLTLVWKRSLSSMSWWHPEPRTLYGLSHLSLIALALLLLAQQVRVRWDLTEEQLYTLSDGSRAIVEKLNEPLDVTFYFSRSHPDLDPRLRSYGQRIDELLREFAASSPKRFLYRTIDPRPQSPAELEARAQGLLPFHTPSGDTLYFGAIYTMGSNQLSVPFFDPEKEDQLEYDLAEAIVKITQIQKPFLGILSSLPVVGDSGDRTLKVKQDWAFVAALRNLYQIVLVPANTERIPDHIRTLLVIHPKDLREGTEYAIDQFLVNGGNLILAVDPFCRADVIYTQVQGTQSPSLASDLPRLLKAWGLGYKPSELVGDRERSTKLTAVYQKIDYPFNVELKKDDFASDHPVTMRIRQLLLAEPGSLVAEPIPELRWTPLIRTSSRGGSISTALTSHLTPGQLAERLKDGDQGHILAGVIEGRFRSAFPGPPEGSPITLHKEVAERDQAVIVIADVDFIADHHSVEKRQSATQMIFKPKNDNLSLLLKSVEFVGGNRDLIAVRSASRLPRPFTRLVARQEQAQERWQEELDRLGAQVHELERQLSEIQAQIETDDTSLLSPDQQGALQRLRLEEAQVRAQRRDLRLTMRAEETRLRWSLTVFNVTLGPLLIGVFWGFRIGRSRRLGSRVRQALRWDTKAGPS